MRFVQEVIFGWFGEGKSFLLLQNQFWLEKVLMKTLYVLWLLWSQKSRFMKTTLKMSKTKYWQRMQKMSRVISALCSYLIPTIVAQWLKILQLFLATVLMVSRKILLSSFYGHGDGEAKDYFCSSTGKPRQLHQCIPWGKGAAVLLFSCLPGLCSAGLACSDNTWAAVNVWQRLWAGPAATHTHCHESHGPVQSCCAVLVVLGSDTGDHCCSGASGSISPLW